MTHPSILIVHKDHPIHLGGINGGAESATLALARAMSQLGHRVTLACMPVAPQHHKADFEIVDLGPRYDCQHALTTVSQHGPYVLISGAKALPLVLAERDPNCLSRVLILHDRHGSDVGLKLSIAHHYCEKIVCVSVAHASELVTVGAPREKLQVVHNGVDLELFSAVNPANRNYMNIVFAGALVQDKGVHLLLQSYASLKGRYPALTLDMYGSAALWGREEFLDCAKLSQQLPGLTFHGSVTGVELARAFQHAGVLVFPSIWFETFGLTLAEALATGCPVVAFDVGGPRDIVSHGHNGLLLSEISVESLTTALDTLLGDPAKLIAFSERALRGRDRFDWKSTARAIIQIGETNRRMV